MMALDGHIVERCVRRFDAANSEDPNLEADGTPKELAYARRMSAWLDRLAPQAPEEVRLAVRAQHICRWKIPRTTYPSGRTGYLRWRRELGRFHADTAGAIMRECGVGAETVQRVQATIRKERFRTDAWAQTLEDVACLVFLDHYFEPFAATQERPDMVRILRKTWRKMSSAAHDAALTIDYSAECASLLKEALGGGGQGQRSRTR
ncbi:MAG: DUF4202 domain-containing protein [Bryobacterales bacterium]|nr:DUF4202 domain-containing protein [Bryobacterales bacterium]